MELNLAVKCGQYGEFEEGVRALLIDKDYSPNWRYQSVELIEPELLNWFFEPSWLNERNPLARLGH